MPEHLLAPAFVVAVTLFTASWGRLMWYCDERSNLLRQLVFRVMTYTRFSAGEVRATVLSLVYYSWGLVGAVLLAAGFGLDLPSMLYLSPAHLPLVILGIVAEISLANLLVGLFTQLLSAGRRSPYEEISTIPWMDGLSKLPAAIVPGAAALGGVVEELVYRGVVLGVALDRLLVAPWLAVLLSGTMFWIEQLIQVRTRFQAVVITSGCVSISFVGGLLVVMTGSVLPPVLCHGAFVVFFLRYGDAMQRQSGA